MKKIIKMLYFVYFYLPNYRKLHLPPFIGFFSDNPTRIASSKTVLSPVCVSAEHSLKITNKKFIYSFNLFDSVYNFFYFTVYGKIFCTNE